MEEEKRHKEVHTLLRDAVTQELGTDPSLGQSASAAEDRVLLLEPARRETSHCSTHTSRDLKQRFGISKREQRAKICQEHEHSVSVGAETLGAQRRNADRCYSLIIHAALWYLSPC